MMQPLIEWVAANLNTHRVLQKYPNGEHITERETVSATVDNPCSLRVIVQNDIAMNSSVVDYSTNYQCSLNLRNLSESGISVRQTEYQSGGSDNWVDITDASAVDCLRTATPGNSGSHMHGLGIQFGNSGDAGKFAAKFKKMVRANCSPNLVGSAPQPEPEAPPPSRTNVPDGGNPAPTVRAAKQEGGASVAQSPASLAPTVLYCDSSKPMTDGRNLNMTAIPDKSGHLGVMLFAQGTSEAQKLYEGSFTQIGKGYWVTHFAPPHSDVVSAIVTLSDHNKTWNMKVNLPSSNGMTLTEKYLSGTCMEVGKRK
jgi:hypothetical protein